MIFLNIVDEKLYFIDKDYEDTDNSIDISHNMIVDLASCIKDNYISLSNVDTLNTYHVIGAVYDTSKQEETYKERVQRIAFDIIKEYSTLINLDDYYLEYLSIRAEGRKLMFSFDLVPKTDISNIKCELEKLKNELSGTQFEDEFISLYSKITERGK